MFLAVDVVGQYVLNARERRRNRGRWHYGEQESRRAGEQEKRRGVVVKRLDGETRYERRIMATKTLRHKEKLKNKFVKNRHKE